MSEKPILFSAPMVRAILDGRKTQTRRILTTDTDHTCDELAAKLRCPYGAPGDRLWVREAFGLAPACHDPEPGDPDDWHVIHRATCEPHFEQPWRDEDGNEHRPPWKPSIFMPRWASRITLEVTGVRVERLQDITEEDARAEGVNPSDAAVVFEDAGNGLNQRQDMANTARGAFACLWDSINGKRAPWASNPWLWVVSFRRVEAR